MLLEGTSPKKRAAGEKQSNQQEVTAAALAPDSDLRSSAETLSREGTKWRLRLEEPVLPNLRTYPVS